MKLVEFPLEDGTTILVEAEQVAQTAAALPDNQALRDALREEIARLWGEAEAAGVTAAAVGDRSVAIGGDVSGSTIITGDRNRVQRG